MRRSTMCSSTLVLAAVLSLAGCGPTAAPSTTPPVEPQVEPPAPTEGKTFEDVRGGTYRVPGPGHCAANVLVFFGHDCPMSNGYAKEIIRLCAAYTPKRIALCVVYADADFSAADARKHATEYGFTCPAILDPKMVLARRVGATVKPEVAVLSPAGELLYRGRIDDRYVDFGKRRENLTAHELRDALDAVLTGKPVAVPRAPAIGCDISLPQ